MKKEVVTFIVGTLFALIFAMSTALAATPIEEADTVSRDVDNIYTMYLGMPKEDFMQNFSDVPNWQFSHKYEGPYPYRFVKDQYIYIRGQYTDPVMHGFMVQFDANDTVNGIDVDFYTDDYRAANAIYATIKKNLIAQFGAPRYTNTYVGHHRVVILSYQKKTSKIKSGLKEPLYTSTEGREGEKLWLQNAGKHTYAISFRVGFPDPRLYHDE